MCRHGVRFVTNGRVTVAIECEATQLSLWMRSSQKILCGGGSPTGDGGKEHIDAIGEDVKKMDVNS